MPLSSSSQSDLPFGSDTWSSATISPKPNARQHPFETVRVGQCRPRLRGCENLASPHSILFALGSDSLLACSAVAAALGSHRFITSGMRSCCRQRDLLALLWAAAFGSDLGFKKAANRGNSEELVSIFGHPLSETRKCDLAKLRQSVTEVKKDGSQHDNGGWVRNFFILLSLVGCQLRRLGGALPAPPAIQCAWPCIHFPSLYDCSSWSPVSA